MDPTCHPHLLLIDPHPSLPPHSLRPHLSLSLSTPGTLHLRRQPPILPGVTRGALADPAPGRSGAPLSQPRSSSIYPRRRPQFSLSLSFSLSLRVRALTSAAMARAPPCRFALLRPTLPVVGDGAHRGWDSQHGMYWRFSTSSDNNENGAGRGDSIPFPVPRCGVKNGICLIQEMVPGCVQVPLRTAYTLRLL